MGQIPEYTPEQLFQAVRARRLAYKERKLLAQQADNLGKTYNVMKNVSTHSMINANDGELDLRLELEDIGNAIYIKW